MEAIPRTGDWTNFTGLTAISWGTNRVDVFALGSDRSVQHRVYDGVWHEWKSLGGILTSDLAVCSWGKGRMDVFGRGADDGLWHQGFAQNRWHGWEPLGGKVTSAAAPVILECRTNYLEIMVRGVNNTRQRVVWDGTHWRDWEMMDEGRGLYANAWFLDRLLRDKNAARYNSRAWRIDDGLPHNSVQAIVQTRDGYLWIGTFNGLARFDGLRFTPFDISILDRAKRPSVTALCETRDGSLWIGTDGSGLVRWRDGEFQHYRQAQGLADDRVRVLYEASDSSLWIGTSQGLTRYKDGKFGTLTEHTGLSRNVVRAIREDNSGQLWVATSVGLNCVRDGVVTATYTNLPDLSLRSLAFDRHGELWVGSSKGVFRFEDKTLYHKGSGLPDVFVSAIHEDRRGNLWIGTYAGLCRLTDSTLSGTPELDAQSFLTELDADKSSFDQINAMHEDREGNLWIGAKDGLHRLKAGPFTTCTAREGLSHNNVLSLLQDKSGALWIATWGGGLNRLKKGRFSAYNPMTGLWSDVLLSLCEDHEGALWIGADFNGGLYRWKAGRFTHYNQENGFESLAVRVIYEDRAFNLWIGTSSGLSLFKDGKFTRYTTTNGLAGNTVRALREDREGNLWVGTDGGLCRASTVQSSNRVQKSGITLPIEPGTLQFNSFTTQNGLPSDNVLAIFQDEEGTLWIGTTGGLARFRKERFTFYTSEHGLFTDEIYEIIGDNFGNLWMSTRKGIFRSSKKSFDDFDRGKIQTIPCVSYGRADGMENVQCNGVSKPAAWKSSDGRLWFATTRGFVVVNPESIVQSNSPPPVMIEEVMADRRGVSGWAGKPVGGNFPLTGLPAHRLTNSFGIQHRASSIQIPPGRGELEFHYTTLSFTAPEKNQFKYKLEGFDKDWIDAGTRRVAFYNNTPPGEYTFRVIACNNDGVWNETGDSLALVLQPHFWQTRWFVFLVAIAGVGAIAAIVRYFLVRKFQRKLAVLEQEHAVARERARIAEDMHDNLGASLTEILVLTTVTRNARDNPAQVESQTQRIANVAERVNDSLHAIVWAINPKNDSLDRLASYLYEHTQSFLETSSIRCRLDVPDVLPKIPVSSEVRHNLFLVVKEALNNLVKYAKASEVVFRLRIEQGALSIFIEDDGEGFSIAETSVAGNGLQNMKKRMETIGGSFALMSEPGKGTRVSMEIPLHQ